MSLEFTFTCQLPNSIHARPASSLEKIVKPFESSVTIYNERNSCVADAKSILSLIGADIHQGDLCRVTVKGNDEKNAFRIIKAFIENEFPHCDEPLPEPEMVSGDVVLPIMLRQEKLSYIQGIPVSGGFGRGSVVIIGELSLSVGIDGQKPGTGDMEWHSVSQAMAALQADLSEKLESPLNTTESGVIRAHLSIVRDPALSEKVREIIFQEPGILAAEALIRAYDYFAQKLKSAESLYVRERILDIQDVCSQLINLIYNVDPVQYQIDLSGPSVVVAENLSPSQFLALDRNQFKGLVLSHGGTTSHTVILARSVGIPTLTGVTDIRTKVKPGHEVIVDADIGILLTQAYPAVERYYQLEDQKAKQRKLRLDKIAKQEARTVDGKRIEVVANLALPDEARTAFDYHAEGIGLFRTEMLYMKSGERPPTEDEQYQAYLQVVQSAGKAPVIIRTLDAGGDKQIPYLSIPSENNPFLGYRAVRLYADYPELIQDQLRAIIRTSAHGTVKVMIPMVSSVDEVTLVKKMIRDIQIDLKNRGISYDPSMQMGIMIEIPSVAFAIDQFAPEVDFFSIGTNDLAQYFFAVDRENKKVSALSSDLNPSFIRLLKKIVDDARQHSKWVGMCGEMAGTLQNLPLLVGLGLDEISLGAQHIPEVKSVLARLNSTDCRNLIDSAMECDSSKAVSQLLTGFPLSDQELSILDTELIVTATESKNKKEIIKELCDSLFIAGRTDNPSGIEEDVWKREKAYATDMGFGIAVPHCKTRHIKTNSIAVLKPKAPVEWGGNENKPVTVVILLVIKESEASEAHMKIFAKLARKVMHEDFRDFIMKENDPKKICRFIKQSLEVV